MTAEDHQIREIKTFLSSIVLLQKNAEFLILEQKRLRSLAEKITPTLNMVKSSTKGSQSRVEEGALQIAELDSQISKKLEDYAKSYTKGAELIDCLKNPMQRSILTARYLSGYKWETICDIAHYSRRHITSIHKEALKNIAYYCPHLM